MTFKFVYNDTVMQNLKDFVEANHYIKVGILAASPERRNEMSKKWNKKNKNVIDAVAIAMVHEFGSQSRNIPKRSFLQKTLFNYKSKWKEDISNYRAMAMEQIANGNATIFLNQSGAKWVRWVHSTFQMEGPGWAPLSKKRIMQRSKTGRAKGNEDPERWPILQDTGQMLGSITHEVV